MIHNWLVVWNMFYDFPIILGMSFHPNWRSHIFQRGRLNHQPDKVCFCTAGNLQTKKTNRCPAMAPKQISCATRPTRMVWLSIWTRPHNKINNQHCKWRTILGKPREATQKKNGAPSFDPCPYPFGCGFQDVSAVFSMFYPASALVQPLWWFWWWVSLKVNGFSNIQKRSSNMAMAAMAMFI